MTNEEIKQAQEVIDSIMRGDPPTLLKAEFPAVPASPVTAQPHFNSQMRGEQPDSVDGNLAWWNLVHGCLEEWQKVWNADRAKYEAEYPKWMVDAAQELFAHDMCDKWSWNDYVKAATVILARHFKVAAPVTGPDVAQQIAEQIGKIVHYSSSAEWESKVAALIRTALEEQMRLYTRQAEIKADTLFGVYCEGRADIGHKELGGINWEKWQRLADYLNAQFRSESDEAKLRSQYAKEILDLRNTIAEAESETRQLREALQTAKVRLEICLGRMRACQADGAEPRHEVSVEELPDWIEEMSSVLAGGKSE